MSQNPPAATTTPGEPAGTIPAETAKPNPRPRPPAPKPAPPREPGEVSIAAGTLIKAALQGTLQSDKAPAGTPIMLTVTEPVMVDGRVAIPAGATIGGKVASSHESGRASGRGEITLAFETISDAAGVVHPMSAEPFYAQAESGTDADVARVAGGAAAGAIIGGIIGGRKGIGLGGLIGAAAGTGTVLATKGPEVKLADGQLFSISLTGALSVKPAPKG
jgi:hypothetical protein